MYCIRLLKEINFLFFFIFFVIAFLLSRASRVHQCYCSFSFFFCTIERLLTSSHLYRRIVYARHHHASPYDYITSIFLYSQSVTAVFNRWTSKSNQWWVQVSLMPFYFIKQHVEILCLFEHLAYEQQKNNMSDRHQPSI